MTTPQPAANASATRHDRRRTASTSATSPNGTTAETSAGYLHAIAPPASRPTDAPESGPGPRARRCQARHAAQIKAAW